MEIKDIERIQSIVKSDIDKALHKGKLSKAIQLIDTYADFTQKFNNILSDEEIESHLSEIANGYIHQDTAMTAQDENTVVFYDQIGTTICLGLQYLRALVDNGYKVIYIFEDYRYKSTPKPAIREEVMHCCEASYFLNTHHVFQGGKFMGDTIRDIILRHHPSKIIVHPQATGALGMSVMYSLKGIKKYRIVPGDHHFYIGTHCFDHFFEFRPFGWSTAVYERHISPSQIYNLPYYPLIDEFAPYQALPKATDGKVILLSGGGTYKFYGSDRYHAHLKEILVRNSNAAFVFLGTPPSQIVALQQEPSLHDRIFFLGYRKDFAAIMQHIDILLNSYPVSGALFCQTAAYYSKPILAFSEEELLIENQVDNMLGKMDSRSTITYSDEDEFYNEAKHLIEDESYRRQKGLEAKAMLQTKDSFDCGLRQILRQETDTLQCHQIQQICRERQIHHFIDFQNEFKADSLNILARTYRMSSLWRFHFIKRDIFKNLKDVVAYIIASYDWIRYITRR